MLNVCRSCCIPGGTHYVKVSGPRFSGKSSIVQWLVSRRVINPASDERPTEGTEISRATFGGAELIIYDGESHDEEDYVNPKWVNLSPNSVQLKQPTGIIFVVDGSDPGRLALAMKILRDLVERLYTADVILLLVTKADVFLASRVRPADDCGSEATGRSSGGLRGGSTSSAAAVMSMLADPGDDGGARDSTTLARAVQSPTLSGGGTHQHHQHHSGGGSGGAGRFLASGAGGVDLLSRSPAIGTHRNDGAAMAPISELGPAAAAAGVGNFSAAAPGAAGGGVRLSVIAKVMNHPSLMQKNWSAHYVSAVTGEGLDDAFSWFVSQLEAAPKNM